MSAEIHAARAVGAEASPDRQVMRRTEWKKRRGARKEKRKERRRTRRINNYRWFNALLKATFCKWLLRAYNVHGIGLDLFERLEPPYLVLPNHMNTFDPFIIGSQVPHPIYWVASEAIFRSKFQDFLLSMIGTIPKTKAKSDIETINHIMRIRKQGGSVGLFPEGQRSWDGHTLPLIGATAKLVRLLKVPVVIPKMRGAYFSLPRWSRNRRRGNLTITYTLGLTVEEIERSGVEQIQQRLTELLEYDEYEYQREAMIPFPSKIRAQTLELALYLCPACESIASLRSRKDRFSCEQCGYSVAYTQYGFFEPVEGELRFDTIRAWYQWQLGVFSTRLAGAYARGNETPVFLDTGIRVLTGYGRNPLKQYVLGDMILYTDRIEIVPRIRQQVVFPLHEIRGLHVQMQDKLEFYHRDTLYSFRFLDRRTSAIKWMTAIENLQTIHANRSAG